MQQPLHQRLRWRKSSYSGGEGGDCVEIAIAPDGGRYLRDSKDRSQPALSLTESEWRAFLRTIKA